MKLEKWANHQHTYYFSLKTQEELDWVKEYYGEDHHDFIRIDEEKMKVFYDYDRRNSSFYWMNWIKDKGRFANWRSKNKELAGVDWSQNRDEMIGERLSVLDELKDSTNFDDMSNDTFRSLYLALCQAESIMEKRRNK